MTGPYREPAEAAPAPFRGILEGREWEYVGEGRFWGPEGQVIRRVEALRATDNERFLVKVSELVRMPPPMPRPLTWRGRTFPGPSRYATPPVPAPTSYVFEMAAGSIAELRRVFFREVPAPGDYSANKEGT
jgi:hypothetical protein